MTLRDRGQFFRHLHLLVGTGTPLLGALEILQSGQSPEIAAPLREVALTLERGSTLSEAMARFPELFDKRAVGLVRMGERSGRLLHAFDRLAALYEWREQNSRRLQARLLYPCVVLGLALVCLGGLLVFVLPGIAELLLSVSREPSPVLQLVLQLANPWVLLTALELLGVGVWFLTAWWKRESAGRAELDRRLLAAPYLGPTLQAWWTAETCHGLGESLQCGCPFLQALELVQDGLSSPCARQALGAVAARVRDGATVAQALQSEAKFFSPAICALIGVAEESGSLVKVLLQAARMLEEEVEYRLAVVSGLLEPLVMLVVGSVVCGVLLLFLVPMSQVLGHLG